jgi:hypothetical protein
MNTNYVQTLGYNLVDEINKSLARLYALNSRADFGHILVDLGFPLRHGDIIPANIEETKHNNSVLLKYMASKVYSSEYVKLPNVGVSQNWTAVYKYIDKKYGFANSDILIGADPDERPIHKNWVRAMRHVIDEDPTIGVVSLLMTDHLQFVNQWKQDEMFYERSIGGERVWFFRGNLNWALIGLSGTFINKIGEIPVPAHAPKYGWIEAELIKKLAQHNFQWCVLPEYQVEHTDYERNSPGSSKLYREWKNDVVHRINQVGQPDFEEWLIKKSQSNG